MKGFIYSLHKKTEDDVFYIGASLNPSKRIISHRGTFPYYKFDCRIGFSIVEELEIEKWDDLRIHEAYWIQQFVAWGFILENYNLAYGFDSRCLANYQTIEREMLNGTFWD